MAYVESLNMDRVPIELSKPPPMLEVEPSVIDNVDYQKNTTRERQRTSSRSSSCPKGIRHFQIHISYLSLKSGNLHCPSVQHLF